MMLEQRDSHTGCGAMRTSGDHSRGEMGTRGVGAECTGGDHSRSEMGTKVLLDATALGKRQAQVVCSSADPLSAGRGVVDRLPAHATNVNRSMRTQCKAFCSLPAKLELKGPAEVHMRTGDIHNIFLLRSD